MKAKECSSNARTAKWKQGSVSQDRLGLQHEQTTLRLQGLRTTKTNSFFLSCSTSPSLIWGGGDGWDAQLQLLSLRDTG